MPKQKKEALKNVETCNCPGKGSGKKYVSIDPMKPFSRLTVVDDPSVLLCDFCQKPMGSRPSTNHVHFYGLHAHKVCAFKAAAWMLQTLEKGFNVVFEGVDGPKPDFAINARRVFQIRGKMPQDAEEIS